MLLRGTKMFYRDCICCFRGSVNVHKKKKGRERAEERICAEIMVWSEDLIQLEYRSQSWVRRRGLPRLGGMGSGQEGGTKTARGKYKPVEPDVQRDMRN